MVRQAGQRVAASLGIFFKVPGTKWLALLACLLAVMPAGWAQSSGNQEIFLANLSKGLAGLVALHIEINGEGTVTKTPDKNFYAPGEIVTLDAMPARWFRFVNWGDGPTNTPRTISIGPDNNYTAYFAPTTFVERLTFGNISRTAPVGTPAVFVDGQFATGAVVQAASDIAQVTMLTTFPNGRIFFTVDGSAPSLFSRVYTAPFTLQRTTIIRARAWDANFVTSVEADPLTIFIEPFYALSAATAGGGVVLASPGNPGYRRGTSVTLTATPEPGWNFLGWLGDADGTNPVTSVIMTRDKCVEAWFGTTLSVAAAGGGSIVRNPEADFYPYGAIVWLTAVPQGGNSFAVWGNAAAGTNNPLAYEVTAPNRTVSAAFGPLSQGQYSLTVISDGFGLAAHEPAGTRFASGMQVVLRAEPYWQQTFLGWTGDVTAADRDKNPVTVTMSQSRVITARFTKKAELVLGPCMGDPSTEGFRFFVAGEFSGQYIIERFDASNTWLPVGQTKNRFGISQFTDWSATNAAWRLYRAVRTP
jgi:hypothetical protein